MEITLELLAKQIEEMGLKLDKLISFVEAIDANTTPCDEKKKAADASMSAVIAMLDKSPIMQNPQIAEMFKPMKDMLK